MHISHSLHRRGFTLVEMLIVIAVIALLAALIFPALGRARESARTKVCLSNMKQLGLGFQQYVQDNGRRYPGAADFNNWQAGNGQWVSGIRATNAGSGEPGTLATTADGTYIEGRTADVKSGALFPYVKSAQVYVCPSNADGRKKSLSYSMNCAVAFVHDVRVSQPSDLVILVDEDKNNDGFFYAVDSLSSAGDSGAPGTSTDANTTLHNGGGNLLFADGHAKFFARAKFPIVSNDDPTNGTQSRANKWAGSTRANEPAAGIPRFHDRAFGPKGSNFPTGGTMDYCFASPLTPPATP